MYNQICSRKYPGHWVILVDQSMHMQEYRERAIESVMFLLEELLEYCITGIDIRRRFYISIIGYGSNSANIVKQGWIDDYVEILCEWKKEGRIFIDNISQNDFSCLSAYKLANEVIDKWAETFAEKNEIGVQELPAPAILNISCEKESFVNQELFQVVDNIKAKEYSNGKSSPLLLSFHFSELNATFFPVLSHSNVYCTTSFIPNEHAISIILNCSDYKVSDKSLCYIKSSKAEHILMLTSFMLIRHPLPDDLYYGYRHCFG